MRSEQVSLNSSSYSNSELVGKQPFVDYCMEHIINIQTQNVGFEAEIFGFDGPLAVVSNSLNKHHFFILLLFSVSPMTDMRNIVNNFLVLLKWFPL